MRLQERIFFTRTHLQLLSRYRNAVPVHGHTGSPLGDSKIFLYFRCQLSLEGLFLANSEKAISYLTPLSMLDFLNANDTSKDR